VGSGAITGGSPRIRERCQDARLVPQGGAPRARDPEGGLQRARGGGDVACRELGGTEKRRGLNLGEWTSPLSRQLDSTAAARERAVRDYSWAAHCEALEVAIREKQFLREHPPKKRG